MAKALPNTVLDAGLGVIDGSVRLVVCSAEPANFAGIAAVALADVTVDSGDFSTGDGTPNGRTLTIAAQNGVTVDADGTPTHVTLDDGSTLLAVTTCTGPDLTTGSTVNVPSWTVRFADPT